eukprot:6051044-Amphidinium_carterae.1
MLHAITATRGILQRSTKGPEELSSLPLLHAARLPDAAAGQHDLHPHQPGCFAAAFRMDSKLQQC